MDIVLLLRKWDNSSMASPSALPPLLLVDDDVGILHLLSDWAIDQGFEPVCCTNGLQALQILDGWTSGIVLADLNMPEMDGLTLCRTVRSSSRSWSPYFLLLTGDETPSLIEDAFRQGVDDFLRKPIGRSEFVGRMKAAVRLTRMADDLRRRADQELERRLHQASVSELREVVSTLAHDLRTPIGALRTTAEMLTWRAKELPPEVVAGLKRIVDISIHLADTVTDVADAFVCEESDPLRQKWTRFDLVAECVRACELVGGGRPVSAALLVAPVASAPLMLSGNPQGIRRLVVNLVSNAIRATSQGEVRVAVAPSDEPGFAVLEVQDTGGGIPVEILPHLGEPLMLSSGAAPRHRAVHGAGLGLAIVRRIAAHHGGRILVESHPGKGTRIRVWLRDDLDEPCMDRDYAPLDTELVGA